MSTARLLPEPSKTKIEEKNVRGMFSKNLFKLPGANPRASIIVGILNAIGTALEALVIIDFVRILGIFINVIPYIGGDVMPAWSANSAMFGVRPVLHDRTPYIISLIAARLVIAAIAHFLTVRSSKKLQKALTNSIMSAAFNPERIRTSSASLMANQALSQLTVEGIPAIVSFYTVYLPTFVHAVAMIPVALIILIPLNAPAAAVLALGMVLVPVAANASRSKEINVHKEQLKAYEGVSARYEESLKGLSTLKLFAADNKEAAELADGSEGFRKATMQLLAGQLRSLIASDGVIYVAIALAAVASVFSMNVVIFISVITVSVRLFDPMRQLVYLIHTGAVASRKADAYQELIGETEAEEQETNLTHINWKSAEDLENNDLPAVHLEKVSLTYASNTTPSLNNVSLDLPCRGLVTLMGPSGSGKSSLASVLSGVSTHYEGSAQLLGTELKTAYISDIAQVVSVMNGTSNPIAGTVRSTLDAEGERDDAQLNGALERVDLHFDLDYVLTPGGANISGGQRQRLLVARAMLLNRPVYILDEASSAVDNEHEEQLWKLWKELSEHALVLVITHRLAHVQTADMALCMNKGELVHYGTPQEVLSTGVARDMWNAQQDAENHRLSQRTANTANDVNAANAASAVNTEQAEEN